MEALKPCPFCGKEVTIKREPLWRGSHGYVGCYEYIIQCDNPDCRCEINLGQNDTVYRDDETARQNAINAWNRRTKKERARDG